MMAQALHGPKGHTTRSMPDATTTEYITGTPNDRHRWFYAAQEDRARKERRDRAFGLIGELRGLMPQIVHDGEQQRQKADEFFAANAERAARMLCSLLTSDVAITALPPVDLPTNIGGWQWVAPSLYADVAALVGANAGGKVHHHYRAAADGRVTEGIGRRELVERGSPSTVNFSAARAA